MMQMAPAELRRLVKQYEEDASRLTPEQRAQARRLVGLDT